MKKISAITLVTLVLFTVFASAAFAAENEMNVTENQNGTINDIVIGNATAQIYPISNQIDPSSDYRSIVAGNRDSFTVSFTNKGNETLTLIPKLVATPNSGSNINESWITISPTNATVAPGAVQKFNIEENVPKDTESDDYQSKIAFTDDLLPNSIDYVNSMQLDISVQALPKIELQGSYISDNVEVGKEYEYRIKLKNVAERDITIDPKLSTSGTYYNPGYQQAFENNAIEICAPSTMKAGEVANMTIKVHVPENATGSYNGYINMNVDGEVNDGSSPQISLGFSIWQQSKVPYVKTFNTTTKAPITIEVSTYKYDSNMGLRTSPEDKDPSFDVGLTHNSSPIKMTLVKSVKSGSLSVGNPYPIWAIENGNIYQNSGESYVETYTAPGAKGDWKLTILPKNTNNFGYSVTTGDTNLAKQLIK
jgi:hypothetical protein